MRWSDECRKFLYSSKAEAKKHLNRRTGKRLRIYFCQRCSGFHLTKQIKRT